MASKIPVLNIYRDCVCYPSTRSIFVDKGKKEECVFLCLLLQTLLPLCLHPSFQITFSLLLKWQWLWGWESEDVWKQYRLHQMLCKVMCCHCSPTAILWFLLNNVILAASYFCLNWCFFLLLLANMLFKFKSLLHFSLFCFRSNLINTPDSYSFHC